MTSAQGTQFQAGGSNSGDTWPAQVDFTQALQNPQISLIGDSVRGGQAALNNRGRFMMWSGSFAAVYKIQIGSNSSVIRCFTSPVTDQKDRYTNLSNFLSSRRPQYLVQFEYLDEGILVMGNRYPLVKMDFVEGENLNKFVGRIVQNQQNHAGVLSQVAERWMFLNSSLRNLGIAHNDLQHGNVIVQNDNALRLVDYDSFYLPDSEGDSPEGGHPSYQHPSRRKVDYNEHVDNFPSFVIYLSLLALGSDSSLWRFSGDQNILFTERDFHGPSGSDRFNELKRSQDNRVRTLTHYLERYCSVPVDMVPNLDSITAAENAGQVDAPLVQGGVVVQPGPSASPASPPSPGTGGQTHAPAAQVQPPPIAPPQNPAVPPQAPSPAPQQQSGQINPASVAVRRTQAQPAAAPTPAASPVQGIPVQVPGVVPGRPAAPPQPAGTPAAVTTIFCIGGHTNSSELIYCHLERCAVVLHPGAKECARCRLNHPVNAKFCPNCGSGLS